MEDIEVPRKKRKLVVGGTSSTENHVTNGDSPVGTSDVTPSRAQSHLQFNPSVFERLRKITKDCQKNFLPTPKPNGSKLPLSTAEAKEVTPEKNSAKDAVSPDFIISSAGSSPAHSPRPMDFNVLSTPPRSSEPKKKTTETAVVNSSDRQKACSRLVERFEESSNKTLSNGVSSDSSGSRTLDQGSSSVEVLEEGDQTQTPVADSTVKANHVNGEINSSAAKEDHVDVSTKDRVDVSTKDRNSPALSDVTPRVEQSQQSTEQSTSGAFNSDEFRKMLKKMIEERMTQLESSMDDPNDKLADRLASLEKENKALKEYAKKVEDSVKNILTAEKEKAKQRVTRAVQTQDPNWFNILRPKTVTSTSASDSVTPTRPSNVGVNVMTTPTPRLTSTVAPLPGHTVPSRLEIVSQAPPGNFRPAVQRQQPEPLRPRIPVSNNISPRLQAPGAYVPNYDPGPAGRPTPSQLGLLRAATPPAHPRFNGVRPPMSAAQPPRPMMRIQRPVTTLAGPRIVAPTPSRPLPTVTVHPQTSSSSTSVRVSQEQPSYGYSTQSVYHNGQPGPRFTVAPQIRPQGPPQISPGSRPSAYPQSPIQASPPQHMLQQPLRPEQQPPPRPHPPVPIRPSAPVQMQSPPPHLVNQHRAAQPQQPGMVHYQQVVGPPRQVAPTQPSGPRPVYTQVPLRPPQPAPPGLPPGAVQPPPIASPTVHGKDPPPKPSVSIAVVTSGIVLSWNMPLEERHAPVMNYQLFALQDGGTTENAHQWKKIGVVKALPLPMACTLTQFLPGNKYHFAVRGTDESGRLGPFSDPCTITLK